ncbi:MAG TPA: hypothetical protein VJH03_11165 [Blastocatellia bacterium]|nr:hypothetical protein [Blastocatellia bacterium]
MKRFLGCLLIMIALPMVASSDCYHSSDSTPLATVAYAGHTTTSGYCDCGAPGCICDPGETPPLGNTASTVPLGSSPGDESVDQSPAPDTDPTPGMLLIALAFMLWFRMR